MAEPKRAADLARHFPQVDGGDELPSLGERWKLQWDKDPDVEWQDQGTNYDDLTMENFQLSLSRSADGGKIWSAKERLDVPFPRGRACRPIKGTSGAVLVPSARLAELSDRSIAFSCCWCNGPDGHFSSPRYSSIAAQMAARPSP